MLVNRLPRAAQQASAAYVDVHTNDGEVALAQSLMLEDKQQ